MPRCGATRTSFRVAKRSQVALNTRLPARVGRGVSALASGHGEHARLDSNQRLLPPEGSALSTELRARDWVRSLAADPGPPGGQGIRAKVTAASPKRASRRAVRV